MPSNCPKGQDLSPSSRLHRATEMGPQGCLWAGGGGGVCLPFTCPRGWQGAGGLSVEKTGKWKGFASEDMRGFDLDSVQ